MKLVRNTALLALAAAASLPLIAQNNHASPAKEPARGRYAVLAPRLSADATEARATTAASTQTLQTWNGSFVYNGTTYTYNMVGAAPSSNSSVSIPVYIIPIKVVVSNNGRRSTFDPAHVLSNGKSVVTNTVDSPLFTSSINYTVGSANVGTTQYIDAYQRANLWGTVQSHTNSHLLLNPPTVLAERTFTVPSTYGKTGSPFGFTVGLVDINWFDAQLPAILSAEGIQPNALPIFLTYDVYLTQSGGCCVGGYHSSEGSTANPQSYSHATYIDRSGTFAQDVSALSHELGEWADDPLTVNYNGNETPCGILENGDPLETAANYGDYSYTQGGFTYHLQDLAFLPYFGTPANTSANSWFSFHNAPLSVCSNGS